jgi:hypothetical protein
MGLTNSQTDGHGRPRPGIFRALGNSSLPERVEVAGHSFELVTVFKHDSWAGTGLYAGESGNVICKFHRQQSIGGFPMRWLGYWLARHERDLLCRLSGLDGVPASLGPVCVDGVVQRHGVAREFVAGHALRSDESGVPQFPLPEDEATSETTSFWDDRSRQDAFMKSLRTLIDDVHDSDVAYTDLHKPENIIAGNDGQPHLIDFQISFGLPTGVLFKHGPARWLLTVLQGCDRYHLQKLIVRHQHPDMPEPQRRLQYGRPAWIRCHRLIAIPFRSARRRLLVALGIRKGRGQVSTEFDPEVALRA